MLLHKCSIKNFTIHYVVKEHVDPNPFQSDEAGRMKKDRKKSRKAQCEKRTLEKIAGEEKK